MPVLSDIAASMASFQSRNSAVPLHALELIGGGSRIPCIQSMTSNIFGIEPSRTLNQSESIAIGATIFGSQEYKLINMAYSFGSPSGWQITAKWNNHHKELFMKNTRVPSQEKIDFGKEGTVDLSIYCKQSLVEKEIARFRFKTPNQIRVTLDQEKILSAQATLSPFDIYELHHKSEEKWNAIRAREEEMQKLDSRMSTIYEMKNDY